MSYTTEDFKKIDNFLKTAQTIDTFERCKTIYELFNISNIDPPEDIELKINAFKSKYETRYTGKYEPLRSKYTELQIIKNILISQDNRNEYNNHLTITLLKDQIDLSSIDKKINQNDYNRIEEYGITQGLTKDKAGGYITQILHDKQIILIKPVEKKPTTRNNSNEPPHNNQDSDAEITSNIPILILNPLIFGFIGYFITGQRIHFIFTYAAAAFFLFYFYKNKAEIIAQDKPTVTIFVLLIVAIFLFAFFTNKYLYDYPKLVGYLIAVFTTFVLEYCVEYLLSKPSIHHRFGSIAIVLISIVLNLFLYLFISIYSNNSNSTEITATSFTDHSKPAIINDHAPHNLATTNLKLVEYIRSRPKNIGRTYGGGHKKIYYYLRFDGAVPGKTLFEVLWYKDGAILKHENFIPNTVKGYISSSALFHYTPGHYQIGLIVDNNKTLRNTASFNVNNPTPIQVRHIKPNRPAAKPPIPTVIPKPTNHNKEQDDNVIDIIKFKTSKDTTATKMRTIK